MGAHRTDMHRLQELVRLHRLGRTSREIARMLEMGRDTIRAYFEALAAAGLLEGDAAVLPTPEALRDAVLAGKPLPAPRLGPASTVEACRAEIDRLRKKGAMPKAIHDWLRLNQPDYKGSLSAVKRLVRRLEVHDGPREREIAIRVETAAGEIGQVDFAYAGLRYDPVRRILRRSWLFVMTPAFSRHQFADLVFDQTSETWILLHVRAFEHFGGVVKVTVPDNLKGAVVRAAFGVDSDPVLNRSYRELARHYGFQIDPTPPRAPQKKGKVERNVGYVRRNFLATNESVDIEVDRRALWRWLAEVAGTRVHGTTGRAPIELFEEQERRALLPLPQSPYEVVIWKQARVHRDAHVQVEGAFYSVPWRHVTKDVWVRRAKAHVTVYVGDEAVATHPRRLRGERSTSADHLPEHRGEYRERARDYWIKKAAEMGQDVEALAEAIFEQDDVLHQLRKVQAVVKMLGGYPRERAARTAARALHFACLDYRGIKAILTKALDLEPLPQEQGEFPWIQNARFARRPVPQPEVRHVREG